MNPERLLQHFDRISEAPEAVPRLRQFILDLAVRGKLVEQNPHDEPAAELLKRIQVEKDRLANDKATKRLKIVALIDAAKVSSTLPKTWKWVRLGDLLWGNSQNGYSKKPDDAIDGIPILRINAGTVRKDGIVAEEEHKLIGGVSPSQQEQYQLQPGDLLACRFNGNRSFVGRLSRYVGYLGINPIYPDKLIRLRLLSEFVLPKIVWCFAESGIVRRDIEGYCATTVGNWGISASNLKDVKIPLPPLAEQHRIVAKVDELMALCDQLEAAKTAREQNRGRLVAVSLHRLYSPSDTAVTDMPDLPARQADAFRGHVRFVFTHLPRLTTRPEHIKQLRQTILNLAVRGRLVPQDLQDESAIKQQGSLAPSPDIVPFPIPAKWSWETLKSLGRLKGGGTPSKSRPDYWDGEIPWVSPKDMKRDYIATAQLSISQEAIRQSAVSLIEPNSLLFVVRGMILAHSFPAALSQIPLTINQDMKALEFFEPEFREYLLRALKGLKPFILAKVQRSSHGTCRLEGADYANFLVPLPPLAEQRRIVAKVDELMALCDQLEAQLTATAADSRRLLEAVLHEALAPALEETA